MAENFSPSGTSIATSTVGVIDDPNYTVYVGTTGNDQSGDGSQAKPYKTPHKALEHLRNFFITRNGFATIKCGAGRYQFSSPLEFRHPQGQRIGIRGADTKDYILAKCSGWKSSHAGVASNRPAELATTTLRGTSACRYYEATVHLQDTDWATSGNALEPDSASSKEGKGLVNGKTGEYVLVRDWTFAHEDNYDTIHNDWGEDTGTDGQGQASTSFNNKNSTKRTPLLGAHPIKENNRENTDTGDGTEGYVKYDCKYYNYPHKFNYSFKDGFGSSNGETTKTMWYGGFIGKEEAGTKDFDVPLTDANSGHMCSPDGLGDYFSNPYPDNTSFSGTPTANPVRFGNTAEGWNEVPTEAFQGQLYGHSTNQQTMRKIRTTEAHHITLNKILLTHVSTIFEMKNIDNPCIIIDGGEVGFIQDLALEGAWQQFAKHMNDKSPAQYQLNSSNHCGIDISEGTLLYKLGNTGDSAASDRFVESGFPENMKSKDITVMNVGINGFYYGLKIRDNSYANVDDIAISNCNVGIMVQQDSTASALRSVLTGLETYGIRTTGSHADAKRSILAQIGVPYYYIRYHNQGTEGVTTGVRDDSFRPGDSLVLNDGGEEQKVGIVRSWGHDTQGAGVSQVTLYDYMMEFARNSCVDVSDLQTQGLKIEHTGNTGGTSDANTPIQMGDGKTFWDTDPANGYLKVRSVITSNPYQGNGVYAYGQGYINANSSLLVDIARYGGVANWDSNLILSSCVLNRCGFIGMTSTGNSSITCTDSKVLNCSTGFYAGHSSRMNCSHSCVENCRVPVRANVNSVQHAHSMHMIEGLSRYVEHLYEVQMGSLCNKGTLHFVPQGAAGPDVPSSYPANYEDVFSPTSIDYTGYGPDTEDETFGDIGGDD